MNSILTPFEAVKMSDREFKRFSSFIYDKVGITLPLAKKSMLEARLHKRLKSLQLSSFAEYAGYVFGNPDQGSELIHLIDAVTTNKTDFFREPGHFDFLVKNVVPEIMGRRSLHDKSPFRVWSAGCASGEEPYTMAMILAEFAANSQGFSFAILASDISTRILESACKAIYPEDRMEPIPQLYRKKYLLSNKSQALVRICPQLRAQVTFRRINFIADDFGLREKMDVIFCRNVVIYFDKATQEALMRKFHRQLKDGGYLFLGHSETLNGLEVDFQAVASTVYRKR